MCWLCWRFSSPGLITADPLNLPPPPNQIHLCCVCVCVTNTKQPNLRCRPPLLSSTCRPPDPLLPLGLSGGVERSLGSVGGYVDGGLAHGLIGHDPGGKLGLSLLKAGIGLPVQAVDLRDKVSRTRWYTICAEFSIKNDPHNLIPLRDSAKPVRYRRPLASLRTTLRCTRARKSRPFPIKMPRKVIPAVTFFSRTTPMAAWAVKKMALIIMMAPTATLWFMAARLTIHPLKWRNENKKTETKHGENIASSSATGPQGGGKKVPYLLDYKWLWSISSYW